MPFADVQGNRLYFEDSGGSGPAVVFSHGGFLDHTIWQPQVEALSGDYRCITWDERAHGMSECNSPFDYWDAAKDVFGILDALEVDAAVLVGMSQGSWLSQRAALTAPERVRGLVLVGSSYKPLSDEEKQGYGQLAQGWQMMGPLGDIANAVYGIQFAPTDYDGSGYQLKWQGKPPGDWKHAWDAILDNDDISSRLGEIACPATWIHGEHDQAFPVAFAEEQSALVEDSRGVTVIPGAPHCPSLTHPDEFTTALRDFLATV